MDEAEIKALLDLIEVWDRRHSNGSEASTWACADVFSDARCYRLDSETLTSVGQR